MSMFDFLPVPAASPDALAAFIAAVFPGRDPDKFWWRKSSLGISRVAIEPGTGVIAGLCVGVPSDWHTPDGLQPTISICGWFVHPDFMGRGLGKSLVQSFNDEAVSLNAFSISDAACKNFAKLGWQGPWSSNLLLLPLPVVRGMLGSADGLEIYHAKGQSLPAGLADSLDTIEHGKPRYQWRRDRSAAAWRKHLSVYPDRDYRFGVLSVRGVPTAYWTIRATDEEAGKIYRLSRLHYVSDIISNTDDPYILLQCAAGVAKTSPGSAGALLLCTTDGNLTRTFKAAQWVNANSRIIGQKLMAKSPRYMFGGTLANIDPKQSRLTFFDSDVDFNI